MFHVISFLKVIYNFFLVSPLSVFVGCIIGTIIGLTVKLPKSGMGLLGIFALVCLSPKIGRNIYLVQTQDVSILANSLLFATTLTMSLVMLYRYYKLDKRQYSKEDK